MSGPEHYREAEQLLALANDCTEYDEAAGIIAQAQVHATLALAAATIDATHEGTAADWDQALLP